MQIKRGAFWVAITALVLVTASTSAEARPPQSIPVVTAQTAYLATMRGLLAGQKIHSQTDAELVDSAKSLCANEVANGLTWASLSTKVSALGMDQVFYRAYVQAAVTAYCPARLPAMG